VSEPDRIAAYVLRIDGVSTIFTTHDDLDTTYAENNGYAYSMAALELPEALGAGIDLRDGGFVDQTITLRLRDLDGTLPMIFGGSLTGAPELVDTIEASTVATANASVWGKCVGLETFGPAGERRQFSCFPGFDVGMRHVGSQEAWATQTGPAPVTDYPRLWTGRRWTIYRIFKEGGTWQALDDGTLVGFGSLLGQGRVKAETWEFKSSGPEGWASGNLGAGALSDPIPVAPILVVGDGPFDGVISASLVLERLDGIGDAFHEWVSPITPTSDTIAAGPQTYDDIVSAFQTLLSTVESDAGSGEAYNGAGLNIVTYSDSPGGDGVVVQWERSTEAASGFDPLTDSARYAVRLRISAKRDIWSVLGYDVDSQPVVDPVDDAEVYCDFVPSLVVVDHFVGSFWSASPEAMRARLTGDYSALQDTDDPSDYPCNFQAPRTWPPIYRGGAVTWTLEAGQEFQLLTSNPVYMLATKSRPVMGDPNDPFSPITISEGVGEATAQGLMVVDGPYRRVGDKDGGQTPDEGYAFPIELERSRGRTQQVFRIAWRTAGDGSVALDNEGYPRLVVYRVEDPRVWGFEYPPLNGPWAGWRQAPPDGRPMVARPLVAIELGSDEGNRSSLVMRRILATTGSAGEWYSDDTLLTPIYGTQWPTPTLDAGANDKTAPVVLDGEVAALGLGIPADLIAGEAGWAAWESVGEHVSRSIVVSAGAMSARSTLQGMLAAPGLCWSLAGGQFGVIDPTRFPSPDAVRVITTANYAGEFADPASARAEQDLRDWSPPDRAEIRGTRDATTGEFRTKVDRESADLGKRYRAQTIKHPIVAPHAVNRASQILGNGWLSECYQRFDRTASFWTQQHFVVTMRLHADDALGLWPGDGIMLTDPWLADPTGESSEYGVTAAIGYVVERKYSARDEVVRIRAMLNAEVPLVLYAPAAVSTEYIDGAGGEYSLVCIDDWLGCRVDVSLDVDGFSEPFWSLTGVGALIEGFAWDGSTWTRGIYGEVDSVVATPGSCKIILTGALTGATYYRDHHHVWVLRAFADQTSQWVLDLFAALCLEDGTHDGGEPGKTFRD
jgi:hypothetical protein